MNLRKEMKMWRFINKKRGRKMFKKKENNIEEEEWKEHFKKLLGGMEVEEKGR